MAVAGDGTCTIVITHIGTFPTHTIRTITGHISTSHMFTLARPTALSVGGVVLVAALVRAVVAPALALVTSLVTPRMAGSPAC